MDFLIACGCLGAGYLIALFIGRNERMEKYDALAADFIEVKKEEVKVKHEYRALQREAFRIKCELAALKDSIAAILIKSLENQREERPSDEDQRDGEELPPAPPEA